MTGISIVVSVGGLLHREKEKEKNGGERKGGVKEGRERKKPKKLAGILMVV